MNQPKTGLNKIFTIGSLMVMTLWAVGCAHHQPAEEPGYGGKQLQSGPEGVPKNWIGFELGLKAPDFVPTRRVELVAENTSNQLRDVFTPGDRPRSTALPHEPSEPTPRPGASFTVASVNAMTGETFSTSWDEQAADQILRAIAGPGGRTMSVSGSAGSMVEPPPPGAPAVAVKGPNGYSLAVWRSPDRPTVQRATWSNGENSFLRLGLADGYGANHRAYRAIGQIGSGCSGVLIGPRHVLTAAHCVVDREKKVAYEASFRPRRDWTEGTPSPTSPHGSRAFVWYYFPEKYWDGSECSSSGGCNEFDIALGILSSDMPVDYMGWWYLPISALNGFDKYHRGYPLCASTEPLSDAPRPTPMCRNSTLYGDAQLSEIGDWENPGPSGYNRELFINSDGARGMSGSPLYFYNDNNIPLATGVYSEFRCLAEKCESSLSGDYPNVMTRITPQYAGWIAAAKSLWSCSNGSCDP